MSSAVHFHRLSSFLRFHVDRELLLTALDELSFLGEIYRLPTGYWYPSSSRCVAIGNVSLVASALPLQELIRQFGHGISMAGSMRLSNSEIPLLQQQSFRSGSRIPDDTQKWSEQKLALAKSLLSPTSIDAALVQMHSHRTSNAKQTGLGTWCRITEISDLSECELYLCRQHTIVSEWA